MCIVQNLNRIHVEDLPESIRCLRCTNKIHLMDIFRNNNKYTCSSCGETMWYSLCSQMLCSKDIGHRKHCYNCQRCQDDRCLHCEKCDECYIPSKTAGKCPCMVK